MNEKKTYISYVCKFCGSVRTITEKFFNTNWSADDKCQNCISIKHSHCTGKYSKTYMIWGSMKQRVLNPKNKAFDRYGGRGIGIAEDWLRFENFLADMGEKPKGLSLERKDNDGDYCKSNCKWATTAEQNKNRRKRNPDTYLPKILTKKQHKKILKMLNKGKFQKQIAKKVGVSQTIVSKVKRGVYYV